MKHSEVTQGIIGVFFEVYNELGPGFLESVYVESLAIALTQAGLSVQREKTLTVRFRGKVVGTFRADLIVSEVVLIEAKACSKLNSVHEAQTLNYLRATSLEAGARWRAIIDGRKEEERAEEAARTRWSHVKDQGWDELHSDAGPTPWAWMLHWQGMVHSSAWPKLAETNRAMVERYLANTVAQGKHYGWTQAEVGRRLTRQRFLFLGRQLAP